MLIGLNILSNHVNNSTFFLLLQFYLKLAYRAFACLFLFMFDSVGVIESS